MFQRFLYPQVKDQPTAQYAPGIDG